MIRDASENIHYGFFVFLKRGKNNHFFIKTNFFSKKKGDVGKREINFFNFFIFSDDGILLSCFQKIGRGPGEYTGITDFIVEGETITVLNRTQQRLLTYDHSGKNILMRNLEYYAQAISPKVDNSFFLYCGTDFNHKLRRINNGQEDSLYLELDKNQAYLFIFADHNFYQYQKSVYFFQPFNDIVYESVEGGSVKPSLGVDFKGKNIPASFLKRHTDLDLFYQELHKSSYAYGVSSFALYDRFLMFCSFYQRNKKLTVFDRENKISETFATIKDDVYFNGLSIPISKFKYHANKSIIVPLDAFDVFEWKNTYSPAEPFKEMVNTTKEEDNPLLLIFDFKK